MLNLSSRSVVETITDLGLDVKKAMRDAVIVSAVRTAVGKAPKGTLRDTRPDEMGAAVIKEALARVPALDMAEIEDVIMGCAMPEAEQGITGSRGSAPPPSVGTAR